MHVFFKKKYTNKIKKTLKKRKKRGKNKKNVKNVFLHLCSLLVRPLFVSPSLRLVITRKIKMQEIPN